VEAILRQLAEGQARVANVYKRAVAAPANPQAQRIMAQVFIPAGAEWRGLGQIPGSGVDIRPEFAGLDAKVQFAQVLAAVPPAPATPCRCGEVLRGVLSPPDCPLFGTVCTPSHPLGPCMVSSEGACAAVFRFG